MLEHNSTFSLSISVTFRFLCHLFGKMVPQKFISVIIDWQSEMGLTWGNLRNPGLKIKTRAELKLSDVFFEKLFNWFSLDFLSNCGFILRDREAESRRGRSGSEVIPRFTFKERKYDFWKCKSRRLSSKVAARADGFGRRAEMRQQLWAEVAAQQSGTI